VKSFKQFFLESSQVDSLVDHLAHQHLKSWNKFVRMGGDYKNFGKLSNSLDDSYHPLWTLIHEITESGYPLQYFKILNKGHSEKWYKELQVRVISKVKSYIYDERQRQSYNMPYIYPELSNAIYPQMNESNTFSALQGKISQVPGSTLKKSTDYFR